jgi:hypothetical protein
MFKTTIASTDDIGYEWPQAELDRLNEYMSGTAPLWEPPEQTAGLGHNQPPSDKDGRKAYFVGVITDWIENRRQRTGDHMRPEEIGAAKDRPFLLLRALLDGVAYCFRENIGADHLDKQEKIDRRGADLVVGVFVVHTMLSDNKQGYSTASAPRVGKLLGRSEKTVRRAADLLVDNRVLGCEKLPGLEDRYWPVINRAFAGEALHLTWWLDATSEATKRGRPPGKAKPRTAADHPFQGSEKPWTDENYGPYAVQPFEKPWTGNGKTLDRMRSDEFTIELTKKKEGAEPPIEKQTPEPKQTNGDAAKAAMAAALNPEASARKASAASQVEVSPTGKVTIAAEFHAELLKDFTDSQIERALERAARYMEGGPEKHMRSVRTACAWIKDEDRKEAARVSRRPGITGRSGRPSL